jgi:hypothetical protein
LHRSARRDYILLDTRVPTLPVVMVMVDHVPISLLIG